MQWAIPFDVHTPPSPTDEQFVWGFPNFICPGGSFCNTCFSFLQVYCPGVNTKKSVVQGVQRFCKDLSQAVHLCVCVCGGGGGWGGGGGGGGMDIKWNSPITCTRAQCNVYSVVQVHQQLSQCISEQKVKTSCHTSQQILYMIHLCSSFFQQLWIVTL